MLGANTSSFKLFTCISGMEATSSVNVFVSCFGVFVREPIGGGNLNVNFRLFGDDGDSGT